MICGFTMGFLNIPRLVGKSHIIALNFFCWLGKSVKIGFLIEIVYNLSICIVKILLEHKNI